LDALVSSNYTDFELIVVDDMSTDESIEISLSKGAKVISTQSRQSGPANARNLAAMTAKGEVLLFVDADVVVKHDTLTKVANAFRLNPTIAALFGSYDDEPAEENFLSQYKNLQHHFVHQTSDSNASTFWAGLGAVRRDVFLSVGGFDCEQFPVPSIEDIELGMRLRGAGHSILLAKEIQAKHLKRWDILSLIRTEILCRAVPWSRLILARRGMINDMNLKTADRLSAVLVGLSLAALPLAFWKPVTVIIPLSFLLIVFYLNRKIFSFFANVKGPIFAAMTFPWQVAYFLYSGSSFAFCWFQHTFYNSPNSVDRRRSRSIGRNSAVEK
jgi:glycosyltransferase involved in cell wall biosynthesis